jgi:basic membrane protein A
MLLFYGDGEVGILLEDGFDRAVSEFGLVAREVRAGDDDDGQSLIDELAEPGGLLLDFTLDTDTAAAARRHRDMDFVAVDEPEVGDEPNLATIRFSSHEASYLAGIAAARTTTTRHVAFVGGVDDPVIWPFEAGFVAGVRAADPEVKVSVRYLARPPRFSDGFLSPAAGERVARRLYRDGADVVFAAAGTSGLGVFEAATQLSSSARRLWGIGVDADQYETVATLPGTVDADGWRRHILTSVVLRFDRAVYDAVAQFAAGESRPGLRRYDLGNDGVGLAFSGGYLDPVREEVDAVRRAIVAGAVAVPCRPARLDEPPDEGC